MLVILVHILTITFVRKICIRSQDWPSQIKSNKLKLSLFLFKSQYLSINKRKQSSNPFSLMTCLGNIHLWFKLSIDQIQIYLISKSISKQLQFLTLMTNQYTRKILMSKVLILKSILEIGYLQESTWKSRINSSKNVI